MPQLQGCDGERPICRRCRVQPPRSLNPCTYLHAAVGGAVPSQLGESMEAMQNRINELEHQLELLNRQDLSKVFLEEPYSNQRFQGLAPDSEIWDDLMQFGGISSPLEVVALWATHVSANSLDESVYSEEKLLARTVHHVAQDIAAGGALPQRILHMIQTEILLSLYYLDYGRLLEANYHCAGATSLAFISGLHQLGTSSQNVVVQGENIPIPLGAILRMEMINAFWSVLLINNYCVAASNTPSSMPYDAPISTPWPTHFPNVALSPAPFLDEDGVNGHSPLTLLAKSSIQLEHAIIALNPAGADLPLPSEFWAIGIRLELFRSRLPPIDMTHSTDQISLITHAFVNVAILRLHSPYINVHAEARSKCLIAASCVALRLADAHLTEWEIVDPILGPLLAAVADVLIASLTHVPQASTHLQAMLSAMQTLARRSLLIHTWPTKSAFAGILTLGLHVSMVAPREVGSKLVSTGDAEVAVKVPADAEAIPEGENKHKRRPNTRYADFWRYTNDMDEDLILPGI
ncbi:hypothetical protein B0H14DRAFT_3589009 [Mycena olivaceomarginata]|nr:hypothetical protein B0H14DRAFT_3589009 [Mycena olivaceomarginata]